MAKEDSLSPFSRPENPLSGNVVESGLGVKRNLRGEAVKIFQTKQKINTDNV